jgi:signal transduction histidine kinase
MVLAIAATFCAAGLTLYFQQRALSTVDSQTRIILRHIAEQTASDIALEARRTLDGPVFETLTAVNHPELRASRLDLVARVFQEGLETYPHVERFFLWAAETESAWPGEALFVGRDTGAGVSLTRFTPPVTLARDAALGRAIVEIAARYASEQHIYVAAENVGPDGKQVLLRLFWTDARRESYFAVLGFVVDPRTAGHRLFAALHQRSLNALLASRGSEAPLRLRVTDEHGTRVHGEAVPLAQAVSAPFPMLFYPIDRIDSRLSNMAAVRPWQIEVSAAPHDRMAGMIPGYWPTVLSVVLMLVALALTVVANRRAADLTRMQADFISHVSHQLKTPLSLLSAATETVTMDRARSPEKLSQYLGIIRGEVARLSALVQRILEYSRLQQQRGFEFERVDLGVLVRETVAAFESSLAAQQFKCEIDEAGQDLQIEADPAAIEQALVNLLDNAVKFSGPSRPIVVRLRGATGAAIIEVADRGIGIDARDHQRIFERFYRGGASAAHREGFGLGLSIVQELVHAHRGRIEVDSMPGEGSTFRIVLPATPVTRHGRSPIHQVPEIPAQIAHSPHHPLPSPHRQITTSPESSSPGLEVHS